MNDFLTLGGADPDTARSPDWCNGSMAEAALLRHEVRNMLTPALLSANMLLRNADPAVVRQAEVVIKAVTRVVNRIG